MYLEYLWNLLSKDWRVISREEAARNRHYGLKGWLLLYYAMSAIGVVMYVTDAMSPPRDAYIALYGDRPTAIRALLLMQAAAQVPFLIFAPLKHRLLPRVWLACLWIPMAITVVAIDMPGQTDGMILRLAYTVGATALISWYVLHSKRVNVTFLHRIPADAPAAEFADSSPATVSQEKIPKPALYQRAQRANRIFWGLAGLLAVGIIMILLRQ